MLKSITQKLSKIYTWLCSTNSQVQGEGTTTKLPSVPAKREPTKLYVSTSYDYTSVPSAADLLTDDSFNIAPDFSDLMSDNLSEVYQTKEKTRATRMVEKSPEEEESQTHTSKWLQEQPRKKKRPQTLLAQTAKTGPHGPSPFASPSSKATSGRSPAYKAIHEAAWPAKLF